MNSEKFKKLIKSGLMAASFLFFSISNAEEAKINLSIGTPVGGKITIRPAIKPLQYFKDKDIIKQKFDFSCGSAATSTLLKYYLNLDLSEEQIVNGLFQVGDVKKIIERKGFSLLDIKKLMEALGFSASGYKTDLIGLVSLQKPAIVAIKIGNYKHFVVFRGIYKGRVFLSDPAFGHTLLSVEDFQKMWINNVALVISSNNSNPDFLKIKEEELFWVSSDTIRSSIFIRSIPMFKSFNEF